MKQKFAAAALLATSFACNFAQAVDYYDPFLAPTRMNRGDTFSMRGYILKMQWDGNFVQYEIATNKPVWSTGTDLKGGWWAMLQKDGNLTVNTIDNVTVWASNTGGHVETKVNLIIEPDGHMEINAFFPTYALNYWKTPAVAKTTCPGGGKSQLYPICVGGMNLTIPACSVQDAVNYAHQQGGNYGACH